METWKPIPSAPDYAASDAGRIKRIKPDRCGRPMRVLAQAQTHTGRAQVSICRDTKIKAEMVHRLIAETFIGPAPYPKAFVCHKDGDPLNNVPSNLYWGDARTNARDAINHGTIAKGARNGNSKLDDKIVEAIRKDARSCTIIAKEVGVNFATICSIKRRDTWKHVP